MIRVLLDSVYRLEISGIILETAVALVTQIGILLIKERLGRKTVQACTFRLLVFVSIIQVP